MKRIAKSFMVVMVMSMFLGLSAQAAVESVSVTSPTANSIVWLRKNSVKSTVKVTTSVTGQTSQDVSYKSSNNKVATVDANGVLTCKKAGKVTITATSKADNNKSDSVTFYVKQKVTKVNPSKSEVNLYVNGSTNLTATYGPENAVFDRWGFLTSNSKVATIDKNGAIVAKKVGTAVITIKAYDGYANGSDGYTRIKVNVKPRYVSSVKVKENSIKLGKGGTYDIEPSVKPASATNKALIFRSDNKKVAKVSKAGKITAKNAGTAKITMTAADGSKKYATITVKVGPTVPITSASLKLNRTNLVAGGSRTTAITSVSPTDTTIRSKVFRSSNTVVATVDSKGMVKPLSAGTSVITYSVTDGKGYTKDASVTITVRQPVTGVTLDKSAMTLYTDASAGATTGKLTAAVAPANATNKEVGFSSDYPNIAAVAADGTVTAKSAGKAVITATTADGKKKATTIVTVVGVQIDTLKMGSKEVTSPVVLNVNGSMRWSNPDSARQTLNKLIGDMVKNAGSLFPPKEFNVGFNGNTYIIGLSTAGLKFTDIDGKDMFNLMNGKVFGEVSLSFQGGADSQMLQKLLDGLRAGLMTLGTNQYKFEGSYTITRGSTVLVLTDIVVQNSAVTFKLNGTPGSMNVNFSNEVVVKNAPALADTIVSVFNGYIVKK